MPMPLLSEDLVMQEGEKVFSSTSHRCIGWGPADRRTKDRCAGEGQIEVQQQGPEHTRTGAPGDDCRKGVIRTWAYAEQWACGEMAWRQRKGAWSFWGSTVWEMWSVREVSESCSMTVCGAGAEASALSLRWSRPARPGSEEEEGRGLLLCLSFSPSPSAPVSPVPKCRVWMA